MSVTRKVILCPACDGFGIIEENIDVNNSTPRICKNCKGSGRLVECTEVTYELIEDIMGKRD